MTRAVAVLVGLAAGCGGSGGTAKTVGELGNGEFVYECESPNDGACPGLGSMAEFPDCIVLGGKFRMDYILRDPDAVDDDWNEDFFVFVASANQDFFEGTDVFRANRVGRAAMLARVDEQIIDMIHLETVAPESIVVRGVDGTPTSSVEVPLGVNVQVDVLPQATGCDPLAGGGPVTAVSNEPSVVEASGGERVNLRGVALGSTMVTVGMAGFEQAIAVNVVEAPVTTTSSGSEDSGTDDTDTGTEDSSGTDDTGTDDGTGTDDTGTDGGSSDSSGTEG